MKAGPGLIVWMAFMQVCLGQERVVQFVPRYAWPGSSQLRWQPLGERNNVLAMAEFDGTNPAGLAFFGLRERSPLLLSRHSTTNHITAVAIAERNVYIASETLSTNGSGTFEVLDVNDLTRPRLLGACPTAAKPLAIAFENNVAVVGEGTSSNGGLVEIFDISEPNSPRPLGRYETMAPNPDVEIAGDYAFLAGAGVHLLVLDISDPQNPKSAGFFKAEHGSSIRLERRGDTIHSVGTDGLHVLDVTDPSKPVRIGGMDRTVPYHDQTFSLDLFQFWRDYMFLAVIMPDGEAGGVVTEMIAQDISAPADFKPVSLRAPTGPRMFTIVGNYAFVPQNSSWIQFELAELPRLKNVRRTGNTFVLEWEGDGAYRLASTRSLTNQWTDRGAASTNRLEIPIVGDSEFFQLQRP